MPTLEANGLTFDYVDVGEGPPLVLLHGLACGWRMWRPQLRHFRSKFRVIAYDQRGHGGSSAPADPAEYSAEHLTRDLIAFLDRLGLDKISIVGFSMGGGPALALALRQAARVQGLVLADIGASAENVWALRRVAEIWTDHGDRGGWPAMAAEMLRGDYFKHYANRSPRTRCHMRALLTQHPLHGICHTLTEVVARRKSLFFQTGALARVAAPTLVLAGQHDGVCHRAAKLIAASIPGAEKLIIPGAGHMVPLEAPAVFNRAIDDFLARTRLPAS